MIAKHFAGIPRNTRGRRSDADSIFLPGLYATWLQIRSQARRIQGEEGDLRQIDSADGKDSTGAYFPVHWELALSDLDRTNLPSLSLGYRRAEFGAASDVGSRLYAVGITDAKRWLRCRNGRAMARPEVCNGAKDQYLHQSCSPRHSYHLTRTQNNSTHIHHIFPSTTPPM